MPQSFSLFSLVPLQRRRVILKNFVMTQRAITRLRQIAIEYGVIKRQNEVS